MEKLLSHFEVEYPADVIWAHGVNGRKNLEHYCKSAKIMMIEGDISMKNGIPVMAHNATDKIDLTFNEWINKVSDSKKGAKLDFKDQSTVLLCLKMLNDKEIEIPIFFNADILQGPNGKVPEMNAKEFIHLCKTHYSEAILSLGWTTGFSLGTRYTKQMVNSMSNVASGINLTITFPVRACYLKPSYSILQPLIEKTTHTITVWNNETISNDQKSWIENTFDPHKIFYDLIDNNSTQKTNTFNFIEDY